MVFLETLQGYCNWIKNILLLLNKPGIREKASYGDIFTDFLFAFKLKPECANWRSGNIDSLKKDKDLVTCSDSTGTSVGRLVYKHYVVLYEMSVASCTSVFRIRFILDESRDGLQTQRL